MESAYRMPDQLKLTEENIARNWEQFKQRFERYLKCLNIPTQDGERKVAILLNVAGPEAEEVFNTFTYSPEVKDGDDVVTPAESPNDYTVVMNKFEAFCVPRKCITYERFKFLTRNQKMGESVDMYVTDLRDKAATCEFEKIKDSLIRDKMIAGLRDKQLQAKLLKLDELTLDQAIKHCRVAEMTDEQKKVSSAKYLKMLESEVSHSVKAVNRQPQPRNKARPLSNDAPVRSATTNNRGITAWSARGGGQRPNNEEYYCKRCAIKHGWRNCPAFGQTCDKCGGLGHFARCCYTQTFVPHHSWTFQFPDWS